MERCPSAEAELPADCEQDEGLDRQQRCRDELHPVFDRELKEAQRVDRQVEERRVGESDPAAGHVLQAEQVAVLVLDMIREKAGEALGPDEGDELRVRSHVGIVEVGMEEREETHRQARADDENGPSRQGLREIGALVPPSPRIEECEEESHGVSAEAQCHRSMNRPQLVSERRDDERRRGRAAGRDRDALPEAKGPREDVEGRDPREECEERGSGWNHREKAIRWTDRHPIEGDPERARVLRARHQPELEDGRLRGLGF